MEVLFGKSPISWFIFQHAMFDYPEGISSECLVELGPDQLTGLTHPQFGALPEDEGEKPDTKTA